MAKVAFVLADDFEDSEFRKPYDCISQAGHQITVIGTEAGKEVKGKKGNEKFKIEKTPDQVSADQFEALVIPGGYSPDKLRMDDGIVNFVQKFFADDKLVAAICHAPSLLVEANAVDGRRLTSWPSVRTDVVNAGGRWEDAEVVEDGNLITSRKPDDLDAFCNAILKRLE
jgi:protease I